MSRLRTVGVILAGGTGTRIGHELPKQLIEIGGRPIIEHTIAAFQASSAIDEILVVMAPGHLDAINEIATRHDKVTAVVEGGATRSDSTVRALDALGPDEVDVLLHDAARPLVTQQILAAVVDALARHEAVDTMIATADTIKRVRATADGDVVDGVLDRHELRRGQTPQAFRLSLIRDAYARAAADPRFAATDDVSVVLRYRPDVEIAVVPGDDRNLKITEPIDVAIAEHLLGGA